MQTERTLCYHPSYKYPNVPCLVVGNKKLAKKYNWKVGDIVKVEARPEGILIKKIEY